MPYDYYCEILSIHDGDTMTVRLDQGLDDERRIELRLAGFDAAEIKEKARGAAALDLVQKEVARIEKIPGFKKWLCRTERTKRTNEDVKSFARYVGHLTATFKTAPEVYMNKFFFDLLKAADLLKRGSKWNLLEGK